jgi:hypothetical protein
MLDSPEDVCAGQARFEYPVTSVLFSMITAPSSGHTISLCLLQRRTR